MSGEQEKPDTSKSRLPNWMRSLRGSKHTKETAQAEPTPQATEAEPLDPEMSEIEQKWPGYYYADQVEHARQFTMLLADNHTVDHKWWAYRDGNSMVVGTREKQEADGTEKLVEKHRYSAKDFIQLYYDAMDQSESNWKAEHRKAIEELVAKYRHMPENLNREQIQKRVADFFDDLKKARYSGTPEFARYGLDGGKTRSAKDYRNFGIRLVPVTDILLQPAIVDEILDRRYKPRESEIPGKKGWSTTTEANIADLVEQIQSGLQLSDTHAGMYFDMIRGRDKSYGFYSNGGLHRFAAAAVAGVETVPVSITARITDLTDTFGQELVHKIESYPLARPQSSLE
jgi:hypothetical protein